MEKSITWLENLWKRKRSSVIFYGLIILSAALRSLAEIAKWRPSWSWIPIEFFEYRGLFWIDPYHIVSNAHWMVMVIVGVLYYKERRWTQIWCIDLAIVWLLHGLANNAFYHFIWMQPMYWGR